MHTHGALGNMMVGGGVYVKMNSAVAKHPHKHGHDISILYLLEGMMLSGIIIII